MFDYKNLFNITNKNAMVIGAGSGIGQAAAQGLAAFGARVICADMRLPEAEATACTIREAGGQAQAVLIDLREAQSVQQAFGAIDRLDILVCTPSINVRKPLLNLTEEEFDRVINLNLRGTFLALREAGKKMVAQQSDKNGDPNVAKNEGSIIVLSSIRSQVVEPGQSIYAATKAGVVQMVRALASELAEHGVRVNAIAPGVVETPLTAQIKNHPTWYQAYAQKGVLQRWAQPEEMVGAIVYLASQASSYVTGSVLFVDGGWTAVDGRFTPPL